MIVSTLLAGLCLQGSLQASDYFPLTEGTKWTYVVSGGVLQTNLIKVAEKPGPLGTYTATVITSFQPNAKGNPVAGTTGMGVMTDGDTAFVVSFDGTHSLSQPQPLFKVGPEKVTKWTFEGSTVFEGGAAPVKITGQSKSGTTLTLFGKPVDTLEVIADVIVKVREKHLIKSHLVTTYGKGIGLVKSIETTTAEGETSEMRIDLQKFEEGGKAGG